MTQSRFDENTTLSEVTFRRLNTFIFKEYGIKLGPQKKVLIQTRIRKRVKALNMCSFDEYCDFIFDKGGLETEARHLADVVTTHKTDFFREPYHFEYLTGTVLPGIMKRNNTRNVRISAWSAGCSTGEEAYTLAMVLQEYAEGNPGLDYSILATDISGRVIDKALKGIYEEERIGPIPYALKKKYIMQGRDSANILYRVVPSLRSRITFKRLNFMDDTYGIDGLFSIILCRNVIIYFDRPTQERIINRFYHLLSPGGYLMLGHSETLSGIDTPFTYEAATIYRKP